MIRSVLLVHDAEKIVERLALDRIDVVEERLRVRLDGRERRAELVRDDRQEVRFELVDAVELLLADRELAFLFAELLPRPAVMKGQQHAVPENVEQRRDARAGRAVEERQREEADENAVLLDAGDERLFVRPWERAFLTRAIHLRSLRSTPAVLVPAAPRGETLLTEREAEVLLHMARGETNAQIAAALFVSLPTVKTHVANILSKLGAARRTQAIELARKRGLLTFPAM